MPCHKNTNLPDTPIFLVIYGTDTLFVHKSVYNSPYAFVKQLTLKHISTTCQGSCFMNAYNLLPVAFTCVIPCV